MSEILNQALLAQINKLKEIDFKALGEYQNAIQHNQNVLKENQKVMVAGLLVFDKSIENLDVKALERQLNSHLQRLLEVQREIKGEFNAKMIGWKTIMIYLWTIVILAGVGWFAYDKLLDKASDRFYNVRKLTYLERYLAENEKISKDYYKWVYEQKKIEKKP